MAFAEAEIFRDRLGTANFESLETALREQLPPEDADPHTKMAWVAKNLGDIVEGCRSAGLPDGFSIVYGALSGNIRERLGSYRTPEHLARAAVNFEGIYCEQVDYSVRFLKGDDSAFGLIKPPWQIALLSPRLLDPDVPPALQAGMGVQGHIESSDLLDTFIASKSPASYHHDYHVNVKRDIADTIDERAAEFIPGTSALRAVMAGIMKVLIDRGRSQAWIDFQASRTMTAAECDELRRARDLKAARFNRRYLVMGAAMLRAGAALERVSKWNKTDDDDPELMAA